MARFDWLVVKLVDKVDWQWDEYSLCLLQLKSMDISANKSAGKEDEYSANNEVKGHKYNVKRKINNIHITCNNNLKCKTSTEGNRIYEWDDEPVLFIVFFFFFSFFAR